MMDRLKMRDMKQRHGQKCRGANCEKGNNGTKMQWWKLRETGNCGTMLQIVKNAAPASMDSQKNT